MNKIINKTVLLGKSGKFYALGFAIILMIAFAHFAGQMFFIQNENLRAVKTEVSLAPPKQTTETNLPKTGQINKAELAEYEAKNTRAVTTRDIVQPKIRSSKDIAPARISEKRRIVRETKTESKAERLRRVERILTGV